MCFIIPVQLSGPGSFLLINDKYKLQSEAANDLYLLVKTKFLVLVLVSGILNI